MSAWERVSAWIIAHPLIVAGALVAALVASGFSLTRLRMETSIDSVVDPRSPLRVQLERVNEHFTGEDVVVILYQTDDVFSRRSLQAVRRLGARLEAQRLPGGKVIAEDVTSLATVKVILESDLAFKNAPLVATPVPRDPAALAEIRRRARDNKLIRENMVSAAGRHAGLSVRLPDGLASTQRDAAVEAIRGLLAAEARRHPGTRFYVSGKPVIDADEVAIAMGDMGRLMPLGYLVTAVLLFLFTRRLKSVVMTLAGASAAIVCAMALLPLVDGAYSVTTTGIPTIITAIAAAIFLHYFSELGKNAALHPDEPPRGVARRTIALLLAPSAIAAATTAVGFAANAASRIRSVRDFGLATGGGVLGTFVIVTLVFALVARWRPADRITSPRSVAMAGSLQRALVALAGLHARRPWLILGLSLAISAAVVAGIGRLEAGSNQLDNFDPEQPVRRATEVMERAIGGSSALVVSIRHRREAHFTEPAALRRLEALERFLRRELGADRVTSPVDPIKEMHRGFFNGDARHWRIPETKEQVAQLLLLNGDPKLHELIDEPYQWVRVMATMKSTDSKTIQARFERADAYLARHFPAEDGYEATTTGRTKLWAYAMNDLERGLVRSFGLAFVAIFAMLFLLFRSLSTGLYSILPNVLPVVFNLGLMGWLGIRLDAGNVMVSSVAIGIAVDDTVHFLRHLRARLAEHGDLQLGIRETLQFKGPAVIGTSVVITAGFSLVLLSSFGPVRHFGLLICVGVMTALLADLVLLPSMLLCLRARLGVGRKRPTT